MTAFFCVYDKNRQLYVGSSCVDNDYKRELMFGGFKQKFSTKDAATLFVNTTVDGNDVLDVDESHIVPNDVYKHSQFEIHKYDVVEKTAL